VDIDLRVYLAGHSFTAPDKYLVTGTAIINDKAISKLESPLGAFDASLANSVELRAWTELADHISSGFSVKFATMTYVCVED
jgi:hypothetical protein